MDGFNDYRTMRVAEVLEDFRNLQYYIAGAPTQPPNMEDYNTEGWSALRQCYMDGEHILNTAADITVPHAAGGEAEQSRVELQQVLLDAIARRHEAQKIYLRQAAAQQWVIERDQILQGGRPNSANRQLLRECDDRLKQEFSRITDAMIYQHLQNNDMLLGRWTTEDPTLREVQRWLRTRRAA